MVNVLHVQVCSASSHLSSVFMLEIQLFANDHQVTELKSFAITATTLQSLSMNAFI